MGESDRIEQNVRKKRSLMERLEDHPELRERFEMILDIVDNVDGEIEKADEAERRAIDALRQLGNEVVQDWAQRQQRKKETEYDAKPAVDRKEKKRSTGARFSEKSK